MPTTSLDRVALWDGEHALPAGRISWDGDRITEVVSEAPAETPRYAVIPGLIDTHVHLGGYAGPGREQWNSAWSLVTPDVERVFHIAAQAQRAMRAGVTTVRDLAGDALQLAVARVFEDGVQVGPRVRVHGQVGMTAGHGDLFTPPHYPHRAPTADSPDACRRLVREWARQGAHGIKIYASGGVLSMGDRVGWRNQTDDEIRATVDEAHALAMPVAAHSHDTVSARRALELGVDSIEHGTGLDASLWPIVLERDIPVAPTLLINDRLADGTIDVGDEARGKAQAVVEERDANFAGASAAGVRFVLGTDANGVMVAFGDQHEEVRLMARSFGWDAQRALASATSDAARAIGMADQIGRLAPGYGADFVVLDGRPWEDISHLDPARIVAVVSRGRVVFGSLPR
ncbi:amidohydrolase family protein [Microbacterium sp. ZXX196]|uniref:metal-dependent hydrolase family protein n=1 Tax=Microbacterium sp. ZXX196 TaxID=2609291 RepID=UPI0012BA08EE|nr:amidohydrolase family protein [Microbacterium sp. ZXX196]MTE23949.1 amidohydrolase family protein [Microbacterium sp. ZXX196]